MSLWSSVRAVGLVLLLTGCEQAILPAGTCAEGCDAGQQIETTHGDGGHRGASGCMTDVASPVSVPAPTEAGGFQDIQQIAFDPQGQLFVLSREWRDGQWTGTVFVLSADASRSVVRTMGQGTLGMVRGMALAPNGRVFVVSYQRFSGDPTLHSFEPDGTPRAPATLEEMSGATSIVVDPQGRVVVGDTGFYRFDQDGTVESHFGDWGIAPRKVGQPMSLVFADDGRLWVADLARNNLQQYDPTSGAHLHEMGGRGEGPGYFDEGAPDEERWGPTSVAMAGSQALYANDPFQSRIQKLSFAGDFLGEFRFGGSRIIGSLAIEPSTGHLYVARKTSIDILCPF